MSKARWLLVASGVALLACAWGLGYCGPSLPNEALRSLALRPGPLHRSRQEDVHRKLDTLLRLRRERGFDHAQSFVPGLTTDEIRVRMERDGLAPTPEIEALFTWRNGSTADDVFGLFRAGRLLSLEEALAERKAMTRFGYDSIFFRPKARKFLPVAGFDGGYVMLPLRDIVPSGPYRRPVWATGDGEWSPYYLSLEHMLDTHLAWYRMADHAPHGLELDSTEELRVWKQINPGLF